MDPEPPQPTWRRSLALDKLRAELASESTFSYSTALDKDAADQEILLLQESEGDLQYESKVLAQRRLGKLQEKVTERCKAQVEMIGLRQEARERVVSHFEKQQRNHQVVEERAAYQHHASHAASTKKYLKAEYKLRKELKRNEGEVSLRMREAESDSVSETAVRTYKVTWRRRPQPVEIRLHQMRIVRDKLQEGDYSVRVSVWDRLGGMPISFSKEDPALWKKQSCRTHHGGDYSDLEILFDDSLLLLAPSPSDLRPTMVFVFEVLFHGIRDEIVGCAVFPLCNSELDYAQGQYKTPVVRGIAHKRVELFADFRKLISHNVDDWLCNLYFEVHKQSTLLPGHIDYTVILNTRPSPMEASTQQDFLHYTYETLRTPDQFVGFQQSVAVDDVFSSPVARAKYLAAELVAELGLLAYRHLEFWISLFFLALSVWLSRYTHYVGEYLFLKGQRVAVTKFDIRWYTADIEYPAQMGLLIEIGVVLLGLVFTLCCFLFLSIVAKSSVRVLGRFPTLCYRFTACFGLVSVLDCLITIVETVIRHKTDGDMYKLANYFDREEGSPAIGAFMTAFLYLGVIGVALFFFYSYLLYVHMNGRLLDMYVRLTASEAHFFIPADCEVSSRYLDWVCFKAKSFRAVNGDLRKLNVAEYTVAGDSFRHLCIYTVGNDHSRVLYRHFMLLSTGAICELSLSRLT